MADIDWPLVANLAVAATAVYGAVLATIAYQQQRQASKRALLVTTEVEWSGEAIASRKISQLRVALLNPGLLDVSIRLIELRLQNGDPLPMAQPDLTREDGPPVHGWPSVVVQAGRAARFSWMGIQVAIGLADYARKADVVVVAIDDLSREHRSRRVRLDIGGWLDESEGEDQRGDGDAASR